MQVVWVKIGRFYSCYNSKTIQDHFVISCCGCNVTLRRCLTLLCTAIMYCNYVLYARNNCLKASHNPTISCRRFGFRHFSLSPLWPCLLSPFRHVAVLTVNLIYSRIRYPLSLQAAEEKGQRSCAVAMCHRHGNTSQKNRKNCLILSTFSNL